jgi:hypothetical protein
MTAWSHPGRAPPVASQRRGKSGGHRPGAVEMNRSAEHSEELEDLRGTEYLQLIAISPLPGNRPAPRLREWPPLQEASSGQAGKASILTGGDPALFSSGWRILDQAKLPVHISPGVSAFSSWPRERAPWLATSPFFLGP